MANASWILLWVVLSGAATCLLLLALVLARIVGVGAWNRRIATVFFGLIGLAVAFGTIIEFGWPKGWLIGGPVALLIPAFGLFMSIARALQYRSTMFDDATRLVAGQNSELLTQSVRSAELDDKFHYEAAAKPIGNSDGVDLKSFTRVIAGFLAGLSLRSAVLVFFGIAATVLAAMRLTSTGNWREALVEAVIAGLFGTFVYMFAAPWITSGWAVRTSQLRQNPELRRSLESDLMTGWLVRILLRQWHKEQ